VLKIFGTNYLSILLFQGLLLPPAAGEDQYQTLRRVNAGRISHMYPLRYRLAAFPNIYFARAGCSDVAAVFNWRARHLARSGRYLIFSNQEIVRAFHYEAIAGEPDYLQLSAWSFFC
jgi:hypothetical protein